MKSILIQIIAAIAIFNLVSMYKESSLLDNSGTLPAPYFSLPQLKNNNLAEIPISRIDLSHLKGQKTVLYFFAPWCTICKISIPNLQSQVTEGDLKAIGIALDFENAEEVQDFTKVLDISFPVLLGNHQIRQNYQIQAYPTYYVIDENLKISARSMGYSTSLGLSLRGS